MTLMTWDHKGKENVNQINLKSWNLWEESDSKEKGSKLKVVEDTGKGKHFPISREKRKIHNPIHTRRS